jgi:hypothetical protein
MRKPVASALRKLCLPSSTSTWQAGGFRHRLSGDDWRLRAISRLDNYGCARTGIFYGGQAMFVRRALFWRLGGFPNTHPQGHPAL